MPDPEMALVVQEIFARYASGQTMSEIKEMLNFRGVRTKKGKEFTVGGVSVILHNRKYIGEYKYGDVVIPDGIPAIIETEIFDRVQRRLASNKKAPARYKAPEEYLLTTKLFCGHCGRLMAGESGKNGKGVTYHYYKCSGAKRKLGCKKKAVKKDWMERAAVLLTVQRVLHDDEIDRIATVLVDMQTKDDPTVPALQAQLAECEKGIANMLNAIQMGILTSSTKERLEALEKERAMLKANITHAQMQRPVYTKDQIVRWMSRFKGGDISEPTYRKQIIDIFLNSIYVYDDKLVFTYNFKDGTETISLAEVEAALCSDLTCLAPPNKRKPHLCSVFLTEKCAGCITGRSIDLPVFPCGSGHLPGKLHPVGSRMLCLPRTEKMSTDFCCSKGSLV